MVSTQIIKNCLEELTSITKVEFCIQDASGALFTETSGAQATDADIVANFADSTVDSQIIGDSYLLKIDDEEMTYILTAIGTGEYTLMIAKVAVSEIRNLMTAYKEKYDRNNFFQNLLLDNLLLVDIHNRAKKLHIDVQVPRAIILVEIENNESDNLAGDLLGSIFTPHNGDYLTEVDENSIIVIKAVRNEDDYEELNKAATVAVDMLNTEAMLKVRAAYGTIVSDLKNLSKSYKEAKMAMDVGKIFYAEKRVMSYNELGIGRLIYQLPSNLCNVFIHEIFGDNIPYDLDNETLNTINAFLDNNLNVSETSRKLFIHRNTLVYRIEKLQKSTGLDIRNFEDAMLFRISLMVMNYLKYLDSKDY